MQSMVKKKMDSFSNAWEGTLPRNYLLYSKNIGAKFLVKSIGTHRKLKDRKNSEAQFCNVWSGLTQSKKTSTDLAVWWEGAAIYFESSNIKVFSKNAKKLDMMKRKHSKKAKLSAIFC